MRSILVFGLVVLVVILCEALPAQDGVSENPTLVLHIGPHKTASTHVQSSLIQLADRIAGAGWFVRKDAGIKWAGPMTSAIRRGYPSLDSFRQLFQQWRKQRRNMIVSTEDLSALLSSTQIQRIRNVLEGFDVKIVVVYREIIQRIYSHYFYMAQHPVFNDKGADLSGANTFPNFYSFLFNMLNTNGGHTDLNFPLLLREWGNVFGAENITVIDYYGVLAHPDKDVMDAILCDVAGILCTSEGSVLQQRSPVATTKSNDNVGSSNVLTRQVVDILHDKASLLGAKFNVYRPQEIYDHVSRALSAPGMQKLPTITTYFNELKNQVAQLYERMVPEPFQNRVLYKNMTANIEGVAQLSYCELDKNAFFENRYWVKFINSEYNELRRISYIQDG